jgi:GntR family transcriptional regulator
MKARMISTSKLQKAYDRSRVPLYLQVAAVMRQRIETRHWPPGEKIPTLEQLEVEFQVARITVRQAVDVLRKEDLLYCRQGRGTFVVGKTRDRRWLKLATDWQSLADSLKGNVPKLIAARGAAAVRPMLAIDDGKSAGAYVFLRSVQYKDGEPYGIVNLHLAQSVYDLRPAEFRARPALSILAELPQVRVKSARQSISVGGADPEVADLLQIALGAPTVRCRCIITDAQDLAVYVADIIYRSDCVRIEVDLLPGKGS